MIPSHMNAVLLTGHGGLEKLQFRTDVPVPEPGSGEVLIEVGACGMNNTDINTRIGWYSKGITGGTTAEAGSQGVEGGDPGDSTWGGAGVSFPRIQGADVAGTIVAVGAGVDKDRVGERVIVDPWLRDVEDPKDRERAGYLGSERDGGYAQYSAVPAENAFAHGSDLTDEELATFPCSSSTAEYMLTKARLAEDESVVITGASGGVGSALVQLAKRRGAHVVAVAGASKADVVRGLGADAVIARDEADLKGAIVNALPGGEADVAADIVGGGGFPMLLDILGRGGRYVTSGAIAGPMVDLDLRTLYLKDLEILGATVMRRFVFENLVDYVREGEIKPLVAKTYPLEEVCDAQAAFLEKKHVGNIVLLPKKPA